MDSEAQKTTVVVPKTSRKEPEFFAHRIAIFDRLKGIQQQELDAKVREDIEITFPDGRVVPGKAWETTPSDVALSISKSLLARTVIARVNGALWDMKRPLEEHSKLEFLDFDNEEARNVYWHSGAHILGEAAEINHACHLCIGPPTDGGFFYEFGMPDKNASIATGDMKALETTMDSIVKERQPFERLVISKNDLLTMFQSNPFKQQIIESKIPDGTSSTVYRCGPLIDLCRGPHVTDTGKIKAFSLLKAGILYALISCPMH